MYYLLITGLILVLDIFTFRKRSCRKVMFLHLSVSHSVHRRGSASVHAGIHPLGQTAPWADPPDRHPLPSACWDTHPPYPVHSGIDMATAADVMHPTGMHSCSCFFYFFLHFTIASYYSVAKLQAQVVFKNCCIEIPH